MKLSRTGIITAILLTFCTGAAAALDTSAFPSGTVLSDVHWTRVETDTTGIFQVTYSQLKEWGFPEPEKVAVYGYGAIAGTDHILKAGMAGDIVPAPFVHTADGRILFFSEGDVRVRAKSLVYSRDYTRNFYSSTASYFLTDSRPAAEVAESAAQAGAAEPVVWHTATTLCEPEIQNPGRGGAIYHDSPRKAGDEIAIPFRLDNYYTEGGQSRIYLDFARLIDKSFRFRISTSDNIKLANASDSTRLLTTATTGLYSTSSFSIGFSHSGERSGAEASFTFSIPADAEIDYLALDKAVIIYPQLIAAPKAGETFVNLSSVAENTPMTIACAAGASDLAVWNTDGNGGATAYRVEKNGDGTAACVITGAAANSYNRLVVFDKAAQHRHVAYRGNISCPGLHAMATPDMVIIASPALRNAAEELADIHRTYQNFDVTVVDQQDIFNEFSSGVRHPAAIRRFLKMLYDRNPCKLRYLLLYGPGTVNHRGIGAPDPERYVVTYQAELPEQARYETSNFASDQYFGMLEDGISTSDFSTRARVLLSVGRLPAESASQAKAYNAKVLNRFRNPLPARKYLTGIQFSDWGDRGDHLKQAQKDVAAILDADPAFTVLRTDASFFHNPGSGGNGRDFEAHLPNYNILSRYLESGAGLFNYCGHGDNYCMASTSMIYGSELARLKNKYLPVAFLATCNMYPFDRITNNVAESMVFNPEGGAIAAISSGRTVYLNLNSKLSNALSTAYAAATPDDCTGDMLRNAREIMMQPSGSISTTNLGNNTLCYNLCGDPAVPLGVPRYDIRVESVNGSVAGGEISVEACRPIPVKAVVTDVGGAVIEDFNGTAVIDLYDIPSVYTSRDDDYNANVSEKDRTITADENILATFPVEVRNGCIDATITPPLPSGEGTHRIVLTATDSLSRDEAAGALTGIAITGSADGYGPGTDTSAPEVKAIYIGDPSFASGGTCRPSFTITAIIDPSQTGLVTDTRSIRPGTRAYLDGRIIAGFTAFIEPDKDGCLRAEYRFENMGAGHHTFALDLLNNAGERAEATLDFTVLTDRDCNLACDAPGIADGTVPATFTMENTEENVSSATLRIADASGRIVRTASITSGTFSWDFTDADGNPVPDGEYSAWILFEAEFTRGSSNTVRFVLIR